MGIFSPNILKSILIFLPAGQFSEKEYTIITGILKKQGFTPVIASDTSRLCEGNNGLKVKPDMNILNINENNFVCIVLIGGNGAVKYWNDPLLHTIINKFNNKKKVIAAICKSAVILAKTGILKGITATCYYENRSELINAGIDYKDSPVVIRKNIITANGPDASAEFAESILNKIKESD